MSSNSGPLRVSVVAGVCLAVLAFTSTNATAGRYGSVTAYSDYGNGSVTAPTRRVRLGREVRLPGGVWIDCAGNCREQLRKQALDFWETIDEESPSGR